MWQWTPVEQGMERSVGVRQPREEEEAPLPMWVAGAVKWPRHSAVYRTQQQQEL